MSNFVGNIVGSLAMYIASVYVWKKLYCLKLYWNDKKVYFVTLLMIIIGLINYFYNYVFIRIMSITIFLFFANKIMFKQSYKKTIISTIISQMILFVADISFGMIVLCAFNFDISKITMFYGTLLANGTALIISIIFANLKIVKKLYDFLIDLVETVKQRKVILFALLIIISLNILLALIYFKLNTYYIFFINVILIMIYSYVVVKNLETSSRNEVIKTENDSLMNSLHQYEDMVDRQRVDNHENKNQLLIIKNMIKKNDKDVVKYIETIVKDQMEDDEALYTRVMTIPSGGLQGIIYQKMLVMKDEHIKFSLDVGRGVREIELNKLSMDDNYRLCKIVGVFLDNAIEESRKIDDKCIMISLFVDEGDLVIEVSNKFEGKIDVDKLDESGYTTKGDGHGYGLSLVKKILSETNTFANERSIKRNVFKQIIKIKNT